MVLGTIVKSIRDQVNVNSVKRMRKEENIQSMAKIQSMVIAEKIKHIKK